MLRWAARSRVPRIQICMGTGTQFDARVYTEHRIETGGGWHRVSMTRGYQAILAAYCGIRGTTRGPCNRLPAAEEQDNAGVMAILWNPQD